MKKVKKIILMILGICLSLFIVFWLAMYIRANKRDVVFEQYRQGYIDECLESNKCKNETDRVRTDIRCSKNIKGEEIIEQGNLLDYCVMIAPHQEPENFWTPWSKN